MKRKRSQKFLRKVIIDANEIIKYHKLESVHFSGPHGDYGDDRPYGPDFRFDDIYLWGRIDGRHVNGLSMEGAGTAVYNALIGRKYARMALKKLDEISEKDLEKFSCKNDIDLYITLDRAKRDFDRKKIKNYLDFMALKDKSESYALGIGPDGIVVGGGVGVI